MMMRWWLCYRANREIYHQISFSFNGSFVVVVVVVNGHPRGPRLRLDPVRPRDDDDDDDGLLVEWRRNQ